MTILTYNETQYILSFIMQTVKFIKSFSKGQITIPKDLREKLGASEEFWMRIFIDDGKLVVEPVDNEPSKSDYLKRLLSLKTDWFSDKDDEDYQRVRDEI